MNICQLIQRENMFIFLAHLYIFFIVFSKNLIVIYFLENKTKN